MNPSDCCDIRWRARSSRTRPSLLWRGRPFPTASDEYRRPQLPRAGAVFIRVERPQLASCSATENSRCLAPSQPPFLANPRQVAVVANFGSAFAGAASSIQPVRELSWRWVLLKPRDAASSGTRPSVSAQPEREMGSSGYSRTHIDKPGKRSARGGLQQGRSVFNKSPSRF
jgi:hypothetical protein